MQPLKLCLYFFWERNVAYFSSSTFRISRSKPSKYIHQIFKRHIQFCGVRHLATIVDYKKLINIYLFQGRPNGLATICLKINIFSLMFMKLLTNHFQKKNTNI